MSRYGHLKIAKPRYGAAAAAGATIGAATNTIRGYRKGKRGKELAKSTLKGGVAGAATGVGLLASDTKVRARRKTKTGPKKHETDRPSPPKVWRVGDRGVGITASDTSSLIVPHRDVMTKKHGLIRIGNDLKDHIAFKRQIPHNINYQGVPINKARK